MQYFQFIIFIPLICRGLSLSDNEIDYDYGQNEIDSTFYNFLNVTLRDVLKKKNEVLDFPILDPFLRNNFKLNTNVQDVIADINLKDLKIKGVSKYIVKHSSISIISKQLSFKLDFPNIYVESFYSLNGSNSIDAPIFGDGKINATIQNFSIDAVFKVSITPEVCIDSMETNISIHALSFDAIGLYNDTFVSEMASLLIEEIAPQIVDEFEKDIAKIVNEYIVQIGNSLLKGLTIKDFIRGGWNILLSQIPSFLKFDHLKITLFK